MQFRDARTHVRTHSAAGVQSGLTGKGERRCAHNGCMNAHTLNMEPAVSSEALITFNTASCPDRRDLLPTLEDATVQLFK